MKKILLAMFMCLFTVSAFAGTYGTYKHRGLSIPVEPFTGGSVFFVDSGSGNDVPSQGLNPDLPFATVDYAIGKTTASNGDIIYVLPGHSESYTDADGFDLDVAGVTIIMLGNGALAPTFTFADTDATIACGAANTAIIGGRYLAGISEVVTGISVEAGCDDSTFDGLVFPEPTTSSFEFDKTYVLAAGADRVTISNNIAYSADAVGATSWLEATAGVVNGLRLTGNTVHGEYSVAPVYSDQINLEVYIADNWLSNMTSGQFALEFTGATTGMAVDNRLYSDAFATTMDPGSLKCMGNLAASAIDEAGTPIPAVGDSTDNYVGTNSADNDAATTLVAANRDGSLLERSEFVFDLLADNETANYVGLDNANNAAATTNVVPNVDGSILERLEAIAAGNLPSYNHPNYLAVSTGTFDTTGTWSTVAAHEVATVTGAVMMTVLPEIKTTMSSVGDNGTLVLGDETTTNSLIASTTIGSGLAAAGEWWVDTSLADTVVIGSQVEALTFAVGNGKDIGYTVGTNALSGGSITFHIWWTPLDSTGAVTAGAGGAL